MASTLNLDIQRGETFNYVLRWGAAPLVYKPVTAVVDTSPLQVTATAHGMPDGWYAAMTGFVGMDEVNASGNPPKAKDYHKAKAVDANTIEFNTIDASAFGEYVSGGSIVYQTPVNLSGFTAKMDIRAVADPSTTALFTLSTANSRIVIDDTAKTITLTISATDTASLSLKNALYDLELISPGDVRTKLMKGTVNTVNEVTA